MSLQEAAVNKTSELQGIIGRVNHSQKLELLGIAITQARESAAGKFNAARAQLAEFVSWTKKIEFEIDEEERKLNTSFDEQFLEIVRACTQLQDTKTQALKICEGNKAHQILLQASKVEFPRIEVLSGPCYVLRQCKLALPDITETKIEFVLDATTRKASIEEVVSERDFSKAKYVDVLDTHTLHAAWRIAAILKRESDSVLIHYEGWSSRWDEWIALDSFRFAPLGKFTGNPREQQLNGKPFGFK